MAKSIAYPLPHDAAPARPHWTARINANMLEIGTDKAKTKAKELSHEDTDIMAALNEAAEDMALIHSCFDHVTEEILVDCLIYELKAASLRHKYFLDLCKSKEIVGAFG
ncbi:MAG: YaaL family protein [Defluviitaleaceae bacterium]|nr:YaaL family protein [Defluviitaleaceae bacterium]